MDIKAIREYLGNDWKAVQEHIGSALRSDIDLLNATNDSILSHSGKQLRPLLTILFARACRPGLKALPACSASYAAAAEILHNATLLHDDVADDSHQRRGVPTIMSLMGPSVSVLVGDYWLVKAMELILDVSEDDSMVMRLFSRTLSDLAEGEMLQLQKAQKGDTDEADYLRIIYNKTGSLFVSACVSGAISVNADEEYRRVAREYATALGMAFQIKDDILDYAGTESVGKPLGVDILEQKITMPLLGAFANAGADEEARVRSLVQTITEHKEYRDEIVSFVKENGGLDYAVGRLDDYVSRAVRSLDVLPDSKEKELLVQLAYYTARRVM